MIAYFIKDVSENFKGTAYMYHVEPPIENNEFVVVSSIPGETLIFPCDINGRVTDWLELNGSLWEGSSDPGIETVLGYAGYAIQDVLV